MDQKIIFFAIIGMMLVTFLPRLLPIWLLSSRRLPNFIERWLSYIPPAVLAALLLPELLAKNNCIDPAANQVFLIAAVPAFLVVWRTRSMFAAVIVGMLVVAGLRFFAGM
ncbi:MAG: AzlD domain-containing protein [Anaerolineaceae bacterium]